MSASENVPAAQRAEYSPSEWPATKETLLPISSPLDFEHADHRHRHRHQRRLCIRRQRQPLLRSIPHNVRKLFAERFVDLGEDGSRLRKGFSKILAHADCLAALAGERECDAHQECPFLGHGWFGATQ